MNIITLRINDDDNKLVRDYAKTNNITISDLVRNSVLEKIEDDIDLKLYNQAIKEHEEDPQDISFDDMMTELDFDE
ncbi:MAG TPA: CopG family transcriptional regulator [Epulopiscium sp.]|nr:CopG family transcriptional regulator [Candidatus Epulonipiscium sp.]